MESICNATGLFCQSEEQGIFENIQDAFLSGYSWAAEAPAIELVEVTVTSWVFWTTLFVCYVAYFLKYYELTWREEEFEGVTINVREPRDGGWGAKPEQFPFKFRKNLFWNFFFLHISALLPGFEAMISSLTTHLDGPGVAGLIAQEMNHACMQTLLNLSVEKGCGIPILSWQRKYNRFFHLLPHWLLRGILGALEAAFLMTDSPLVKEYFTTNLPEPRALWFMHLAEEAEHVWSSVPDLSEPLNVFQRIASFLSLLLLVVVILIFTIVQTFIYKFKDLFVYGKIYQFPIFLLQVIPVAVNMALGMTCIFVMKMWLSDATYDRHCAHAYKSYKPYEHLFRITHRQKPGHDTELARRKSFASPAGDGRRISVLLYSQQKRMSVHQGTLNIAQLAENAKPNFEEDKKILALRTVAYEKAKRDLITMGLKPDEIQSTFMEDLKLMETLPESELPKYEPAVEETGDNPGGKPKLPSYTPLDILRATSKPGVIWIIINNMVVDVSKFAAEHPGGTGPLESYNGRDATKVFMCIHDPKRVKWSKYVVGKVVDSSNTKVKA